jgi:hypothetical protein
MKQNLSFFGIAFCIVLLSCNGAQNGAAKQAEQIQSMVKQASPGYLPTSADGITLTAKIDGKDWKATGMMRPDRAGVIIGENNGESISLPYYDRRSFLANNKRLLGDDHGAAEVRLNDDVALWTATKGEVDLTKVDENWAEGKFSFTAKGFQSDKTIEVTDGFFRISLSDKK